MNPEADARQGWPDVWALLVIWIVYALSVLPLLMVEPAPGAPGGDETGFIDPAISLLRTGKIATDQFGPFVPGSEQRVYWQPPVYFIALAGWFGIWGVGLAQARLLSFLVGALALLAYYFIARRYAPPWACALGLVFPAAAIWFQHDSRLARMDNLAIMFIAFALWAYAGAIDKPRRWRELLTGLLCGIAVVTHPLGVIAPTSIVLHKLWSAPKELLRAPFFWMVVGGLPPVAAWAWYIGQDYPMFHAQMALQLLRKQQGGLRWSMLANLEHYALFFAAFIVATAYVGVRSLRTEHWRLPCVFSIVALVMAVRGAEISYTAYYIVPMGCCVAIAVAHIQRRRAVIACVALALLNQFALTGVYIVRSRHVLTLSEVNREVRAAIPPGVPVIWIPGDFSPYFALRDRNPFRVVPPTPMPAGVTLEGETRRFPFLVVNDLTGVRPSLIDGRTQVAQIDFSPSTKMHIYGPITLPAERR